MLASNSRNAGIFQIWSLELEVVTQLPISESNIEKGLDQKSIAIEKTEIVLSFWKKVDENFFSKLSEKDVFKIMFIYKKLRLLFIFALPPIWIASGVLLARVALKSGGGKSCEMRERKKEREEQWVIEQD